MSAQILNPAQAHERGLQWSILSRPAGPIAEGFMADLSQMSFIMGPVGSAKTTTCFGKLLNIARMQEPSMIDGARKAKFCVVRTTYNKLWESTIPSYWKIFPKHLGKWNGGRGDPADHELRFLDDRFGELWVTVQFRAIRDQSIEDFVAGYEVTGWYLNELDHLPEGCLGEFGKRLGRAYKDERPKKVLSPTCIIGDFNAPDEDNWVALMMDEQPDKFHVQPSGFSPNAENMHNLNEGGKDYYREIARTMKSWEIKRYIENKIGFSRSGEPVYPEYNPDLHDLPDTVTVSKARPIVIGLDGMGDATAIITQMGDNDRILVLDEILTPKERKTDGYSFGKKCGEFLKAPQNGYWPIISRGDFLFVGDPANFHGGREAGKTFMEAFSEAFEAETQVKCRLIPAETNSPETRQGAVRRPLKEIADGRPRIQVSKRCIKVRRGFASGYKLKKMKTGTGDVVYLPVKNEYSHPHDALQYACLYFVGVGHDERSDAGFSGRGSTARRRKSKPKTISLHRVYCISYSVRASLSFNRSPAGSKKKNRPFSAKRGNVLKSG